MDKLVVNVFVSGTGSTLISVNECIKSGVLNLNIANVVISKTRSDCLELSNYCEDNNLNVVYAPYDFSSESRDIYLTNLREQLVSLNSSVNLYLFLGWNLIVNDEFIRNSPRILNLHPSLPNSFVGTNCIRKAYESFRRGEVTKTGSMVHEVIVEVDKGKVLDFVEVDIYECDTYESLEERVKSYEKGLVLKVLLNEVKQFNSDIINTKNQDNSDYVGKVRTVSDIGYNYLLMTASNRLSAFDKHICDIPNKGSVLNHMSTWWFKNTSHIIDNHHVYSNQKYMVVKKCRPIKLEFVIRGYMTGSTNTSIWPMYKNGNRNMYGISFRDGYKKNEKLDRNIITPTTKGVHDSPITRTEILEQNYLTEEQYNFIESKTHELFSYGQMVARSRGLILVDTKYEFGFYNDKIILIDEVHTCDSSRYWKLESYDQRMNEGLEPEKLDKDCVRDYVKKNCDPYKDPIPEIPSELIEKVTNVYQDYYNIFEIENKDNNEEINRDYIINNLENIVENLVVIISGSVSDKSFCEKIQSNLNDKNIFSVIYHCSAHKNTKGVLSILSKYEVSNQNIIYVTIAGMSNALSGVVSCNTRFPVIGCPPFKDKVDMMTNINSTLQCPSNVPVMTILSPLNVSVAINKIFNLN